MPRRSASKEKGNMPRISEEEINEIRSKADIVDIIGRYVPLEKKGKEYRGRCPFHNDHNPSMNVSRDLQIYKCFSCGAGGNVFTFVQNYEKVSFIEAVGKVASISGIPFSLDYQSLEKPEDPRISRLHKVLEETIRFTTYQLEGRDCLIQREYLEKRGLDSEVRKHFEIGYNPDQDKLYRFLHAKGYTDSDMTGCNVARLANDGMHDVFYDRITFPIHDVKGKPIGFSARTLDPQNPSKYINTNETEIFKKGNIVYNYHRARLAARRSAKVYVCEGVTDVIAFYKAGIENAVCTLGTACTENQLKLIKEMTLKIVFCYDGDDPGQAATWKAAKLARQMGCEVGIVVNKTKKDPDEIIREGGKEALQEMIQNEVSWMEFVIAYLSKDTNMNNYSEKRELVDKVRKEIDTLQDDIEKKYFTDRLSELTGFHLDYEPQRLMPAETVRIAKNHVPKGSRKAEEQILKMMLNHSSAIRIFEEKLGFLNVPVNQTLAMMIVDNMHSYGVIQPMRLIDETDDQELKNLITGLLAQTKEEDFDEKAFNGAIRKVRITVLENEADAYKQQLTMEMNPESKELIFNKYSNCLRELRRYIDEENSQ